VFCCGGKTLTTYPRPKNIDASQLFKTLTVWVALTGAFLLGCAACALAEPALTLANDADDADPVELTLEDLSRMPQTAIVTENEFSDGRVVYRGPLVRDVLAAAHLEAADTLRCIAANDYHIDIPASDFRRFDVIIAMEADGKKLSRRDKGPLWIMYPISEHAELRDSLYIHRLIWQLTRIEGIPD
jgi:hypothetical protein